MKTFAMTALLVAAPAFAQETQQQEPFVLGAGEVAAQQLIDACADYLGWNILFHPGEIREGGVKSRLQRQVEAQEISNRELTTRNRLLDVEVADLKDGLDTVEEIAREELGMVREGESFYLMIDQEDDDR